MEKKEIYIRPLNAYKKIKAASQTLQPVYISGVTGYGKTELVKQFLGKKKYQYLSCTAGALSMPIDPNEKIVVIDDISFLTDPQDREAVLKLSSGKERWLILIGRSNVPNWLMQTYVKHSFLWITEEDLALGEKEAEEFLTQWGKRIDQNTLIRLQKRVLGHPIVLKLYAMHFDKDIIYDEKTDAEMEKAFFAYLEQTVFRQWDRELMEFLLKISIVDTFTEPLAEMILSCSNVLPLIERAEEIGNFLWSENEVYFFRDVLKKNLRKMLRQEYDKEQINELYYNAGLYYEITGKFADALEMYEQCGNHNRISALLMKNAEKNPGSGSYYEMRKYYFSLPEEYICREPKLMAGMSMLYSLMIRPEESEIWYQRLAEFARKEKDHLKKEAKNWLIYLDIALPHRGSENMIGLFKSLPTLVFSKDISLPEFSVTSNLPSLMNGGKDFCEWSPHDQQLAGEIGKIVEKALRANGAGLMNIAMGESSFEKGGDSFEVMNRLNRGKLQAEAAGKIELCFVAVALLAKLNLLCGEMDGAMESLMDFKERILREKAERLLPNFEAVLCRMALYQGNLAAAEKWLHTAPKEEREFYIMERYRYLTKIRVYLAKGSLTKAISLLQKILYYAEQYERRYITMEGKLLMAVCLYRQGDARWQPYLKEALFQAEKYHFVRLISLEGAAAWELLEKAELTGIDPAYLAEVKQETKLMAQRYPAYLKERAAQEVTFGENAIQILRFLAEGLSYKEIAQSMGIKEDTVRYHIKESYRKLGVNGKAEAVMEAARRRLI